MHASYVCYRKRGAGSLPERRPRSALPFASVSKPRRGVKILMDLRKSLNERIDAIADGEHKVGLEAVSRHIDAAMRHHARGRKDGDETAYADAIYRCNQAFEGSIKEAYRVLAQKDPEKKSPAQIEKFLSTGSVLRGRVLAQLTNYRQEWRNPSTHDYKLDFDEDEALLAIVSVSAFAIVLCDQIIEKLTFIATQQSAIGSAPAQTGATLLEQVSTNIVAFAELKRPIALANQVPSRAYQAMEAELGGFLSSALPEADVALHAPLISGGLLREADVLISSGNEKVAVELKVTSNKRHLRNRLDEGTMQALKLLHTPGVTGAVLVILSLEPDSYFIEDSDVGGTRLKIVAPDLKRAQA